MIIEEKPKSKNKRVSKEMMMMMETSSEIEKILAHRKIETKKSKRKVKDEEEEEFEYLVKFKDQSYSKSEWVSQELIESIKIGKQRLQRFHSKFPELDPDPPYDPEYDEIDRILFKKKFDGDYHYLVKWQGLPYDEATWELCEEVDDPVKVAEYERINKIPNEKTDANTPIKRPGTKFKKLKTIKFVNDNALRSYQVEGVNWLRNCWYDRRNSILADEMGLGKTIQSVSIIWYLYHYQKIRGPFLVIAPLSTIPHWRREFESWTDMNAIVYHGNTDARNIIRNYEWHYLDKDEKPKHKSMFKFNVIVTTYEMILTDTDVFKNIFWKYIVIDEAHRLKNKTSRVLNEFSNFKYDHLLLLTGTPIQNNTQELWTLMNLLDPESFPDLDAFMEDFGNLKDATQVSKLHDLLKPYILRRMKEDVEKSIAPKEETIIEVELTTIQKKYYKAILERNFDHLIGGKSRAALPSLLNVMMQLRKCCNHPFLLKGVEEAELGPVSETDEYNETLIEASGKLVLIDKLLPRLQEEGHKVLIFSQMVRVLDILEDYMTYRDYKFERIDGSVRGHERQASIDRFSKDKDIFVFLLCTRAGGVGINLTAADTVIIFDSDWNPQNDLQAQARCHRIGQEKAVKVYRLLTRNTYERHMFERASQKLGLDQVVLNRSSDEDGEGKPKFTTQEVDSLLKYGVYDLFRDDDSSEKFKEENIEDIFARRTTRVVHETREGSTFSKASFTSNDANDELDIDDPDFWKKVMPNLADKPDPNIIQMPRQRKKVFRTDLVETMDSDEEGSDELDEHGAYSEGSESDDEHYLSSRSRPKRTSTGQFVERNWNIAQRNRFIKALTLLGFGRWKDIRQYTKFKSKSLKELALYGRAYLKKVLEYAESQEDMKDVIVKTTNCKDRKEELTEDLMETPNDKKTDLDNEKGDTEKKDEPEKLEPEKKLDIMNIIDPPASTQNEEKPSDTNEGITWNIDTPECEEDVAWFYSEEPQLNEEKFLQIIKSGAAQTLKRFELLVEIGDLVRSNFSEFEIFPHIDGGNFFESWWGPEQDKDLLIGTYKWGFGQYLKMIKDPELCFYGKVKPKEEKKGKFNNKDEDDEDEGEEDAQKMELDEVKDDLVKENKDSKEESKEVKEESQEVKEVKGGSKDLKEDKENTMNDIRNIIDSQDNPSLIKDDPSLIKDNSSSISLDDNLKIMPPSKILTHRVKHILKAFNTLRKKRHQFEDKEKRRLEKLRLKMEKDKKKDEKEQTWSKRERQDFYRVVTTYGIPFTPDGECDFEFIKAKAKLTNKTIRTIQKFYTDFLEICKFIKTTKWNIQTPGSSEPENLVVHEDQELVKKATDMGFSYGQAKRAFDRIAMFSTLRNRVLPSLGKDDIRNVLGNIERSGSDIPFWWNLVHDEGILYSVNKHGFGKWKDVCEDPELPFYQMSVEKKEGLDQEKVLPKDSVLLKRIGLLLKALNDAIPLIHQSKQNFEHPPKGEP